MAYLGIHFNELPNELLEAAKFGNLAFGLFLRGRIGKRLRHCLSFHFVSQSRVGTVHRLAGLVTTAVGLATTAAGIRDRPAAQIAQTSELFDEFGTPRLEIL
ncbi:MAG: hypothetical protein WAM39_07235 [Bryobacteraceae bacterium]